MTQNCSQNIPQFVAENFPTEARQLTVRDIKLWRSHLTPAGKVINLLSTWSWSLNLQVWNEYFKDEYQLLASKNTEKLFVTEAKVEKSFQIKS